MWLSTLHYAALLTIYILAFKKSERTQTVEQSWRLWAVCFSPFKEPFLSVFCWIISDFYLIHLKMYTARYLFITFGEVANCVFLFLLFCLNQIFNLFTHTHTLTRDDCKAFKASSILATVGLAILVCKPSNYPNLAYCTMWSKSFLSTWLHPTWSLAFAQCFLLLLFYSLIKKKMRIKKLFLHSFKVSHSAKKGKEPLAALWPHCIYLTWSDCVPG